MSKEIVFHNSEFEKTVRTTVNIFDRPINEEDIISIESLDCSDFNFSNEDFAVLVKFSNLKDLGISTCYERLNCLKRLPKLEELFLEINSKYNCFGFNDFKNAKNLKYLFVSGGDYSDIIFHNLEHLQELKSLKYLGLHEFGPVNLAPLENMTQLEEFYCGYGKRVMKIDTIKTFKNLKALTLIGFTVKNLNFLDAFPNNLKLELCGLEVQEGVDINSLKRFTNADISEISVNKEWIIGSDGLK